MPFIPHDLLGADCDGSLGAIAKGENVEFVCDTCGKVVRAEEVQFAAMELDARLTVCPLCGRIVRLEDPARAGAANCRRCVVRMRVA